MVKKCPPGVICIENMTLLVVFISCLVVGFVVYLYVYKNGGLPMDKIIIQNNIPAAGIFSKPNDSYSNGSRDVLLNPYVAPLKDNQYLAPPREERGVPVNVRTQNGGSSYSQVGILTRVNGSETILPLMGKLLISGRDKWQYYTMSDKQTSVKLPVSKAGKSCTSEYGCDNLYNGDTVYVEGYNDAFKATIYESNSFQYIPHL